MITMMIKMIPIHPLEVIPQTHPTHPIHPTQTPIEMMIKMMTEETFKLPAKSWMTVITMIEILTATLQIAQTQTQTQIQTQMITMITMMITMMMKITPPTTGLSWLRYV